MDSRILSRAIKRLADISISSMLLIALSPLLLSIALAIRIILGKPVLFVQVRPGLHGKLFRLVKYRSMKVASAGLADVATDEERLTGFGGFMRRTSLDELPQLWNVLRGEMSLVGPRPLLVEYLPFYSEAQARRHHVKPGITGWAQVNGRNALTWDAKFELDAWYVDHLSIGTDIRILVLTLYKVFRSEGVSHHSHATMPAFNPRKAKACSHQHEFSGGGGK